MKKQKITFFFFFFPFSSNLPHQLLVIYHYLSSQRWRCSRTPLRRLPAAQHYRAARCSLQNQAAASPRTLPRAPEGGKKQPPARKRRRGRNKRALQGAAGWGQAQHAEGWILVAPSTRSSTLGGAEPKRFSLEGGRAASLLQAVRG